MKAKKLMGILLVIAVGLLLCERRALAASNATVTVSVTVSGTVSVTVSPSSYAFGSLGVDVGSVSSTPITVTNPSTSGLRETMSLSASNSADWTLASTPGTNNFVLAAIVSGASTFTNTNPTATIVDSNHALTTSAVACNNSAFAWTAATTCQQVSSGNSFSLWFEMVTPTQLTAGSGVSETSTVAITAAAG